MHEQKWRYAANETLRGIVAIDRAVSPEVPVLSRTSVATHESLLSEVVTQADWPPRKRELAELDRDANRELAKAHGKRQLPDGGAPSRKTEIPMEPWTVREDLRRCRDIDTRAILASVKAKLPPLKLPDSWAKEREAAKARERRLLVASRRK